MRHNWLQRLARLWRVRLLVGLLLVRLLALGQVPHWVPAWSAG
jgi:hypothetical protein